MSGEDRMNDVSSWKRGTPVQVNPHNYAREPVVIEAKSTTSQGPTVVDLFCGAGGFSEGFRMSGFTTILGVDVHAPSAATFARNHQQSTVIMGDVRKVSSRLVKDCIGGRRVDVVTAGVPCQGFSNSNRKRHDGDERNFLFQEFIRVVKMLEPRAVVLENVSSLRAAAAGGFARAILDAVTEAGFKTDHAVLNAVDYGVPQRRRRVFFVGTKEGAFRWPPPSHGNGLHPPVTVRQAFDGLPVAGCADRPTGHEAPRHPAATVERIRRTAPGDPLYPRFRQRIRLDPDAPSPTQVAGGIRPQPQHAHPWEDRGLTLRELCRLQGFPDTYEIIGDVTQARLQVGNAVPPPLAAAIGRSFMEVL